MVVVAVRASLSRSSATKPFFSTATVRGIDLYV